MLDTHVWVWWPHGVAELQEDYRAALVENEAQGLGVSVISCWEVTKLVEHGRLRYPAR